MSDIVLARRPDALRLAIAPALCLGLAAAVGTLALVRLDRPAPAAAPPAATALPAPRWLEIPRPVQIYSLQSPELRGAPMVYSARRSARGNVREDRLAFGAAGDKAMLHLSILRGGAPPPTLERALPDLLATDGLKARLSGAAGPLATRFGSFEVAAAVLGATTSACTAFRRDVHEPALAITGVSCSAAPALPRALACLIDRLDLASAGEDRALTAFFAAAELRRDPTCRGMRLGPDGLHAPWLDDKPATPAVKTRRHTRLSAPTHAA